MHDKAKQAKTLDSVRSRMGRKKRIFVKDLANHCGINVSTLKTILKPGYAGFVQADTLARLTFGIDDIETAEMMRRNHLKRKRQTLTTRVKNRLDAERTGAAL